jgi:hypothetical protein
MFGPVTLDFKAKHLAWFYQASVIKTIASVTGFCQEVFLSSN